MIVDIVENEIKNYIEQSPLELDKELVWTKVKELVKHDVSLGSCLKIENANDNEYYSLVDII